MTDEKESFWRGAKKAKPLVSQHLGISIGTHNLLVQDLRIIPRAVQIDVRLSVLRAMVNVSETECH
jgi:hypothetical protein